MNLMTIHQKLVRLVGQVMKNIDEFESFTLYEAKNAQIPEKNRMNVFHRAKRFTLFIVEFFELKF